MKGRTWSVADLSKNKKNLKKKKKYLLVPFCALVLFFSCKKDKEIIQQDLGYSYFPVKPGSWIIYDVDSIFHDEFKGTIDTFHFQVKEVIESVFLDNSERETQRIERYKRSNDSLPWVIKNVWTSNRTSSTAERVEDNQRFVKLNFPPDLNKSWNGNAFNTLPEMAYSYKLLDSQQIIGGTKFDSTLIVVQVDDINLIQEEYAAEYYAKNVGMIYKKIISVKKKIGAGIISGLEYKMTIRSFGS
jgi:hypothetical protein